VPDLDVSEVVFPEAPPEAESESQPESAEDEAGRE
jgi:hypothetical protein